MNHPRPPPPPPQQQQQQSEQLQQHNQPPYKNGPNIVHLHGEMSTHYNTTTIGFSNTNTNTNTKDVLSSQPAQPIPIASYNNSIPRPPVNIPVSMHYVPHTNKLAPPPPVRQEQHQQQNKKEVGSTSTTAPKSNGLLATPPYAFPHSNKNSKHVLPPQPPQRVSQEHPPYNMSQQSNGVAASKKYPPPPPPRSFIAASKQSQSYTAAAPSYNPHPATPTQAKETKPSKPSSKIDPSQIPRLASLQQTKSFTCSLPPCTTPPPPPNTRILYTDACNATPATIRPISYMYPSNRSTLEKTGLPNVLFLTPLGGTSSTVPLFDGKNIIRCKNCHVYIHASVTHDAFTWMCQFCETSNPMQDYSLVQELLQCGTVEYNVNHTAYDSLTRSTNPTSTFIYAIHMSSIGSCIDILRLVCKSHFALGRKHAVGIVFYSCNAIYIPYINTLGQTKVAMTCDVNDPFAILPLSDWLLLSSSQMQTLFHSMPDIISLVQQSNKNMEGHDCLGSVLHLLKDSLQEVGGKCVVITSSLAPNAGKGRCSKKNPQYIPDEYYEALGLEYVKSQVSIDLFYLEKDGDERIPQKYITSLLHLCYKTGGRMHRISHDDVHHVLLLELLKSMEHYQGAQCVLKLRVSSGLKISTVQSPHAGILQQNKSLIDEDPEIELSSCSIDTSISYLFDYKIGGLKEKVHFQSGFLYTSRDGNRVLRVSTLTLQTTTNVQDVFRFVDSYALSLSLLRTSCAQLLSVEEVPNVDTIKHQLMHRVITILKNYRCHTNARSSPSTQLILPDTCQLLPLLLHASFASPLFSFNGKTKRLEFIHTILYNTNPLFVFMLLYPIIYALDDYDDEVDAVVRITAGAQASELDAFQDGTRYTLDMDKKEIYPSRANIEEEQSYLFDNGYDTIYIYHPKHTTHTPPTPNKNLLHYLRSIQIRPMVPTIKYVDQLDQITFSDDFGLGGQNYEDFLCFLHKRIRLAMDRELN